MKSIKELGARLDEINSDDIHDLMSRIFVQFGNNLGTNSYMELYAAAINSVREHVQLYMSKGSLDADTVHIPGLNDYNTYAPFHLIDSLGTNPGKLRDVIGFSDEEIQALREMLVQITKNKVAMMEAEL